MRKTGMWSSSCSTTGQERAVLYASNYHREQTRKSHPQRRGAAGYVGSEHPGAMLEGIGGIVSATEIQRKSLRGELHRQRWQGAAARDAPAWSRTDCRRVPEQGNRAG